MPSPVTINIGGRVYHRNPEVDRYQVHISELGDFRIRQIPAHSHLEVLGFPEPDGLVSMECYGLNDGSELSVYGGPEILFRTGSRESIMRHLQRAFPLHEIDERGRFRNPSISLSLVEGGILAHVFLNYNLTGRPDALLRDVVVPYSEGNLRLKHAGHHLFICHSSEDKQAARSLATAMREFGAEVWFDEWEIRVGDSIVQKISEALGTITHLVVLLSRNSVSRPWVQKELSSALMRQLSDNSVAVLPVRLDDCAIPAILSDIKYADARNSIDAALPGLRQALMGEHACIQAAEQDGGGQPATRPESK